MHELVNPNTLVPEKKSGDIDPRAPYAFIGSGTPMRDSVRRFDWSGTPLGPIDTWPASLKTTVSIVLNAEHPMFLWWGPQLIQIYNDAYLPSFGHGNKHPAALGQAGVDCWQEIWPIIWPQIEVVLKGQRASWYEDKLIPILRNGHLEDVYWSYTYTPVYNEDDLVAGVLVVCTETTRRVLAERREKTLLLLKERLDLAMDCREVLELAASTALTNPEDIRRLHISSEKNEPYTCPGEDSVVRRIIGLETPNQNFSLVFDLNPQLPFDELYQGFISHYVEMLGAAIERVNKSIAHEVAAADRDRLLMNAPVGTAVFIGDELVIKWANQAYCDIIERYNIVGQTFDQVFPELIGTPLQKVYSTVYKTGIAIASKETHARLLLRGKLQDCYYTYNLVPLLNPGGEVYGLWVIMVDITEQVTSRKETERLNEELNLAARAKDEFLAMLGHELRNPLAPIVTALQVMELREPTVSQEQIIIQRQVDHLVRLVDDLLDVSKITRGKVELRFEPVELRDVLSRAIEMADYLFEQKNHHLHLEAPPISWFGDPARLTQVVANLLTNAARYTPAGGMIKLTAAVDDTLLRITVEDNGVGIAPELLPRIFDIFVQGSQSADRREGGLGIGLSLVKNLVHLHGGEVTCESPGPGCGSRFTVVLPSREHSKLSAPPSSHKTLVSGKKILVVDDNEDAAASLANILTLIGHRVTIAHHPIQAIEKVVVSAPDIAILDIGLPGMDGYELCSHLHAILDERPCRFIALSGYGQEKDKQRSKAAGFSAHLVKPVDIELLLRLLADEQVS